MEDIRRAAEELHARKDSICTDETGMLDLNRLYAYNKALEILKTHLGILSLSKEEFEKHLTTPQEENTSDQ